MINSDEIIFNEIPGKNGNLGQIILNRPTALNALTHAMIQQLANQLTIWSTIDHIKAVIIQGTGEKAFCAGGDIRKIYEVGKIKQDDALKFFYDEYRLNYQIKNFNKPYISFLDGITMGGGAGVSVHGSHRVATERFIFAMPETGIGFFTDIGASYFLSRCADNIGIYLGLTGARIKADDAYYTGIVNHIVHHEKLNDIINYFTEVDLSHLTHQRTSEILQQFSISPGLAPLAEHRNIIANCFNAKTVEEILSALNQQNSPWCDDIAKIISTKSPTSLKIVLEQLRRGANLDFASCMQMEFALVKHFLAGHDFYEGIRAVLVDKDQNPKWDPANISDVSEEIIKIYFKPHHPLLPLAGEGAEGG